MKLTAGTKLGAYEIVGPLGSGGMGEVYRAHDTKLKRDVAIKILPDEFALDRERVARFQREAEVLASLNHPHIAAIYDFADFGDLRCLVLELVEGETLAERIKRGPVPIDDALHIAKEIAEALEAAHEKGIVHRDLKPANLKLTPAGDVKVLDFGLAKVRSAEESQMAMANSPTLLTAQSSHGMLLGTAAYMSPEQAKGKDADRTSDVWAFGCVLYEMLAGKPVFDGETLGELVAGILKDDPDWRRLPDETPESIRRLLRRCLQKERTARFHDMADVRIEIEEADKSPYIKTGPQHQWPGRKVAILGSALAVATAVAIALSVLALRPKPSAPEMRLEMTTPPSAVPNAVAISPDGQKIVFVATSDARSRLWLRGLASSAPTVLAGTDGARTPFWSTDSRTVGFFAEGKLKRVDLDNGLVQVIASIPSVDGATWNAEGTILYGQIAGPITRIPAGGGTPVEITHLAPRESAHRGPRFLPDGKTFLYQAFAGGITAGGTYIGHLDKPETQHLLDAGATAYLSSGQLLFVRGEKVFAQDFDPGRAELKGTPVLVAEQASPGSLTASATGVIVYRTASTNALPRRQFMWIDRSGKEGGKIGDPLFAQDPSLSPDGHRVAVSRQLNGWHIWILDLERDFFSRFTFRADTDQVPIWCGGRIIFGGNGGSSPYDLYEKSVTSAGSETLLLDPPGSQIPTDCSADGRVLLYRENDPKTGYDIWALPLDGKAKPFAVVQTAADERDAQFSPDGKWIAYQSDESGHFEIYVQPFPNGGGKFQVSTNGGEQVRWRRDGKELFYIAPDERLMAVPIRFGQTVEPGEPAPLFTTHIGGRLSMPAVQQYAVSPDGQRFLMNTDAADENSISPISVILNWARK